jgi:hypothetical protein
MLNDSKHSDVVNYAVVITLNLFRKYMMDFKVELKKVQFDEYDEADMEMLYDFIECVEKLPNKRDAIPSIFSFMEESHDKELGSPGPLVHFLEEENDYHEALKKSLNRKPTVLTLWMVNRIINGVPENEKSQWLSVLESVSSNESADDTVKSEATEYLEHQGVEI